MNNINFNYEKKKTKTKKIKKKSRDAKLVVPTGKLKALRNKNLFDFKRKTLRSIETLNFRFCEVLTLLKLQLVI